MPGRLIPIPDPPRPDLLLSLPALRARLEEQRQFRIEQIASLAGADEAGAAPPAGGDLTESLVDTAQSQVTAALLTGARQALADIDTALYRIVNGQYGNCLACGQSIDMQRLQTLPQTALCADCHRGRTMGADPASRSGRAAGGSPNRTVDAPAGRDATLAM
jgi:DnaK suppressor protein